MKIPVFAVELVELVKYWSIFYDENRQKPTKTQKNNFFYKIA